MKHKAAHIAPSIHDHRRHIFHYLALCTIHLSPSMSSMEASQEYASLSPCNEAL